VPILFVGAAPGNAGGRGTGARGAHGTRIPFGGDIAGANLDALIGSIGLSRNDVFLTASYNALPARGGGEPTAAEIGESVGTYESSLHLLRDTMIASGAALIVALGNVGARAIGSALRPAGAPPRLLTQRALERCGAERDVVFPLASLAPDSAFRRSWARAWRGDLPHVLWTTHPSAQNMSPFARTDTLFHTRMLATRAALQHAARTVLGLEPPRVRPHAPSEGIYALADWRALVAPQHARLDALWRAHGV
jgi:uracil-DNA glycosylase